jgi:Ca2+-binding RTX toxin-like protein
MPTTAEQQLALELINRSRSDPSGEFDALIADADSMTAVQSNITSAIRYFGVDLDLFMSQLLAYTAVAPLSWSDTLATSATAHNTLMIQYDQQSHNLPGEPGLADRFDQAGYDNWTRIAENIYAYSYDIVYAHAGFYIDWGGSAATGGMQDPAGHRNAILNGAFTEIGIAWQAESDGGTRVGPYLTTQHFGTRWDYDPQLLGVVIDDLDDDDFYDIGEGLGGVTITAVGASGTFVTTSWESGGYQMVLPNGVYEVTFSGGALEGTITMDVTISGENAKLDAFAGDAVTAPSDPVPTDGNDSLVGTADDELLEAGLGDDTLAGTAGRDTLSGGAGDDLLIASSDGQDLFDGGDDTDTVDYTGSEGRVLVDLQSDVGGTGFAAFFQAGASAGDLFSDVENVLGGTMSDNLRGDGGDNHLQGGGVSDRLYGRAGDDTLDGGTGADALYGNSGADVMTGGPDAGRMDRFIYFQMSDSGTGEGNRDVITDFVSGEDRIEISRFDADIIASRNQAFTFIGDAGFSGTAGELGYVHSNGDTIVQADVDGDTVADFEIELIGIMELTASDFIL